MGSVEGVRKGDGLTVGAGRVPGDFVGGGKVTTAHDEGRTDLPAIPLEDPLEDRSAHAAQDAGLPGRGDPTLADLVSEIRAISSAKNKRSCRFIEQIAHAGRHHRAGLHETIDRCHRRSPVLAVFVFTPT